MIALITPPLAHAGNPAVSLLYLAPILIGIALVAVQSVRDRRRDRQPAADAPESPGDPLER
jgi:hypothetical protein